MKKPSIPTQNNTAGISKNSEMASFVTKLFLRAVIAAVLSMIVYLSVGFIFTSIGTKPEGYTVYVQDENSEWSEVSYFTLDELSNPEDVSEAVSPDTSDDETAPTRMYKTISKRSEMPAWLKLLSNVLSEICMLGMYISMLYIVAWEKGETARQHRKEEPIDELYGLLGGLIATIPLFIAWAALLVSKFGWFNPDYAGTFQFIMAPWFPVVNGMMGASVSTDVPWWAIFAVMPFIYLKPFVTHVAYTLGTKDIVLRDQILYGGKKKKKRKKKSYRA